MVVVQENTRSIFAKEIGGAEVKTTMKLHCVAKRFFSSSALLQKLPKNGKVYPAVSCSEGGPPAVTLLVGWMASREKVIGKYTSIYTRLGIPCVVLAPNERNVVFTSSGKSLCEAALDALLEMKKEREDTPSPLPLIIHLFSGAGYAVFPKLLETWAHSNSVLKKSIIPRCIIFDSGPTKFAFRPGVEAANLILHKERVFTLFMYKLAVAIVTSAIGSQKQKVLQSALESDTLHIPQLYLYSLADTVVRYEWLQGIMENQREKGRSVSSHSWEHTEHLKLYLDHKEEYTQHIHSFLKSCELV